MCGIIGLARYDSSKLLAKRALKAIDYRGKEASMVVSEGNITIGHNLHSIVGFLKQPLTNENSIFSSNCEIYNWEQLASLESINATNDADLVHKLLDKAIFDNKENSKALITTSAKKNIINVIESLDGDFAFAYYLKKQELLFLARDIAGVKPLVYHFDSKEGKFAFASEKKALEIIGIKDSIHLNPRKILCYNLKEKELTFISRKISLNATKQKEPLKVINKSISIAVEKRIPIVKSAILLSGGLDSAIIAKLIKSFYKTSNLDIKVNEVEAYFAGVIDDKNGLAEPKDLPFAISTAKELGLKLNITKVSLLEFESELPKIISLIESIDPIRIGVASTLYFATKEIAKSGAKVVFSGLGADELFAGYNRFQNSIDINKDVYSYFIKLYENDLYYQDIVCMNNNLELRVPFLDKAVISNALILDPKYKINKKTGMNKIALREFALTLGLSEGIALRAKKAAQYGSNFDKAIEVLAKKNGFKSKAEYLNSIAMCKQKGINLQKSIQRNIPIAALLSTGKDSIYALHLMQKQGYPVKCLITIDSKNKDSFMFHTPIVKLATLQAKALNLPLIIVKTKGEKENELIDLKKAISTAIKKYGIEGVVSGALFSNYQRERIETICEDLGIRAFAPLWHTNQSTYLTQLVNSQIKAIITKIACYGLDEKWLGREIDLDAIKELINIETKYKINVAGEGGEYESLVLDAPFFKNKIMLSWTKKMQNEFTGEIKIQNAKLTKKWTTKRLSIPK